MKRNAAKANTRHYFEDERCSIKADPLPLRMKMKASSSLSCIPLYLLLACAHAGGEPMTVETDAMAVSLVQPEEHSLIDIAGTTIATRFIPPKGGFRTIEDESSFAGYLRQLPLKPHNSEVKLYDGSIKPNYSVYEAVVDLKIGARDLHQCADAIMRLRAEHLWEQQQYEKIHFNFTNGFRVDYSEWIKGRRIIVKGNKTYWSEAGTPSNTYEDLWKYLETIFTYAGSLSLSKELEPVAIEDLKIGDIFILGGTPGHAIIVVDLAVNEGNNEKYFLLAQSYMPAQEIHILKNPHDMKISPWYSLDIGHELDTPEWTFTKNELKRFKE